MISLLISEIHEPQLVPALSVIPIASVVFSPCSRIPRIRVFTPTLKQAQTVFPASSWALSGTPASHHHSDYPAKARTTEMESIKNLVDHAVNRASTNRLSEHTISTVLLRTRFACRCSASTGLLMLSKSSNYP